MKIARLVRDGKETYGIIKDDNVATKENITYETGVPLPLNIKDFLFNGWYNEIKDKISNRSFQDKLEKYRLLSPIPNPSKIICLTFNYPNHAKEQNLESPKDPVIFFKPRTSLCGTGSEIKCPKFVKKLDYEVELAVIIGNTCKNIDEKRSKESIFGCMIFNDVSARDIQIHDKQFTRGKSFDTFAPSGPWITNMDEVTDPQSLRLTTKVNGHIRQDSSTKNMFIKIPSIISKLSKVMTLEKGDIITTGTPEGVALNNPDIPFLKDGDEIEMEIEKLGKIKNTVRFTD
jgi:2-keto-4-pentenoate hydratase/2-oxohepta-3-ene-1,7-dioic acid hydratase in catechol pathway|tara:strand:+ start:656 stop:1519 length:864 start_codon:yes stop_codon:yes gene_type:complete